MAISYTTLTADVTTAGSLRYQVRHSMLAVDYILERAQEAVYSQLRVREMVAKTEASMVIGDTVILFPDRMLEPISLWRTGQYKGEIKILDHDHFEQRVSEDEDVHLYDGCPSECTFTSTRFLLNAAADIAYPYRLFYVQTPAPLSAQAPSNAVTDRYGQIFEAMAMHYAWMDRQDNDQKADNCLQRAMGYIAKANEEYDMFRQQLRMEAYWSRD